MDFEWSAEFLAFKKQVIDFAKTQLNQGVVERDAQQFFPKELWEKCADFGIQSLALPKKYGGKNEEVAFSKAMLAMEGFGYGCEDNGLAFGLNAQMWTVQTPILHFGNEAQKQKYLPAMANGKIIGAHALTEPNAGSDVYNMQMTAEKVTDGYILNGKKHLITFAPICDFVLVFATTNPARKQWGISAFLVDTNTKGFLQSDKKNKMGMRSIPIGDLVFENCFIPTENLLGSEGLGYSILNHSLEYDRCCILASQLGRMEKQLEQAIDFVKNRKQFNQPVGQFQSVSNRIVEMKLRLETSRLLLYKTAWLKEKGENVTLESAMLKLHLSESFMLSSLDFIRSFGGSAYLSDNGIERDLRDSVGGILYAGTSDIQRNIIAKLLGI
ncbi:MAG: acyl-CoA dehydrogenase family protein [Saprospiraceae bacterium]